jgi:hypothetical protein
MPVPFECECGNQVDNEFLNEFLEQHMNNCKGMTDVYRPLFDALENVVSHHAKPETWDNIKAITTIF